MRSVGTVVRGVRAPIIKPQQDLAAIVVNSLLTAQKEEKFTFRDHDIVAVTEAVVGIAEANYASVDTIAADVRAKFPTGDIGVVFPILSRNRFSIILKSIARGCEHITLLLSYPSDEVGNAILDKEAMENYGVNPYSDVLSEAEYMAKFGDFKHVFTGINMVDFYREVIEKENCRVDFVFANQPQTILNYTTNVLACDIHTRFATVKAIKKHNAAARVYDLTDIMTQPIDGSGCNPQYGLLGSNRVNDEKVKLFPKDGQQLVERIQQQLLELTGKTVEVMVYGDGAFRDPVGQIWELADPVVSPAYTKGLEGTPNELKLKYISDNKYAALEGSEIIDAVKTEIKQKADDLKGSMATQGTTPRRYTDLIGSLCDLTSGSGDKGTPIVFIQGYFDNYADD